MAWLGRELKMYNETGGLVTTTVMRMGKHESA